MTVGALSSAAAVLLIVAGLAKLRTPGPAAAMIAGVLHRRGRRPLLVARLAGTVEVLVGGFALAVGDRVALALLAAAYFVLTSVAVRLATAPQRTACGCFGAADGTVGLAHLVFDVACLAVALCGVVRPPGSVAALFEPGVLAGLTVTGQVLLLAALGYLSITALPALSAARRQVEGMP